MFKRRQNIGKKAKVLCIGIRATDNIGDAAINTMLSQLFTNSGISVVKMEFNFREVVRELFQLNSRFPFECCIKWLMSHAVAFRFVRILIGLFKVLLYLPVVFIVFSYKQIGCSKVFIGGGNLLMGIEQGFPLQVLSYTVFSRLFGMPVTFVSVGVGPFTAPGAKSMVKMAALLCDRIICRDSKSLNTLIAELDCDPANINVLSDPVLIWPQVTEKPRIVYDVLFTFMPLFSPSIFIDGSYEKANHFKLCMVDTIVELIKSGKKVGVLVSDSGVDLEISNQISKDVFARLGTQLEIEVPLSPEEMAAYVSSASMVFSTRMHGAIMAMSQLTPAVCVNWQSKIYGLYTDLKLNNLLIELDVTGSFPVVNALQLVDEVLDKRRDHQNVLNQQKILLQTKYEAVWAEL